ncbi:MAG: S1C family serine protease [Planctomycetota bacterium]|nr:S1C family serine protease [Planctomycetota bacterium]
MLASPDTSAVVAQSTASESPSKPTIPNATPINASSPKAPSPTTNQDLPSVIEKVQPSVVKIITNEALGSGFVVDEGLIVTNRHVMEGARTAKVHFKDGQTHVVEGIVFDGGKIDLCILKCKGLSRDNSKPLQLASQSLRQGESLFTFGAPKGLEFSVSEGIVSANRWIDDIAYVQTTAPISSGNSGGPLLSTKDGSLVGINTWTRVDGQNLNFAIAVSHLKEALEKCNSEPVPLNLTENGSRASLATEANAPTVAELMKTEWEEKVASRRAAFEPKLEKLRASVAAAESAAAKSAFTVQLAEIMYQHQTAGQTIILDLPKLYLSQLGKLNVGTYGFVQDRMEVIQILNEWNCLLYLNGIVFLLEDYPTENLTTNTILVAKEGPVMYLSGTYRYTSRLGSEKQVFRVRPAWNLETLSKQVVTEQNRLARECDKERSATIRAALTRTWTSSSFSGQAQFKSVFGINGKFTARLTESDGSEITVPLEDLSEQDQAWIADYRKHYKR